MIGNQITIDRRSAVDRTITSDGLHDAQIRRAGAQSRRYIGVIIILQCAYLAVVLGRSWFVSDDLENLGLAHDQGLTLHYLRLNIFGHFAPVHRLLDWIIFSAWPLDWRAAELLVIAMLVMTSWVLYRIARLTAPGESWPTLLVALFALSPVVTATAIWWAAAAASVPAMLLVSLATLAALRYSRVPRWPDAALYGASLAVGLLTYEKTALAPIAIAAFLWATHETRGTRAMTQLVRRCAPLIALSIVVVVLWAIEIKLGKYDAGVPSPSLDTWWSWFSRMMTSGPFAAAAGVNSGAFHGSVGDGLLVLAGAAALTVVVYSTIRFRGAWRAWVFFGLAFFPGFFLTAYGRAALFGPGVASDPHYLIELAPALVLALIVAFSRPPRVLSKRHTHRRISRNALVVLALVPVVAVSVVSGVRAVDTFEDLTARSYFNNLEHSANAFRLSERPGRYTILNTDVPFGVVPPAFAPYNSVQFMLPLLPATRGQDYAIDGKPLLLVLPSGVIVRATLRELVSLAPTPGSACVAPTSVHVPPSTLPGDDRTMVFAVIEGMPSPVTVSVLVTGQPNVVSEVGPYAAQIVQGSADGRPVRLLSVGESELEIAATPGSCITQLTLLAARPGG